MHIRESESIPLWEFASLARQRGLRHFVSARSGGVSAAPFDSLNLGFHVGDRVEHVIENRRRLARATGTGLDRFVTCTQAHGNTVQVATERHRGAGAEDAATAIADADALITNRAGLMLMVQLADCVPVLLFDPRRRAIGLAHAGWRGTVARVTVRTVEQMASQFGSRPEELMAAIGPSIGPCCYEVGTDVIESARELLPTAAQALRPHPLSGKAYFDLWQANRAQLVQCGVLSDAIEIAGVCTRCHADTWFSDRAQRPTGRFGAGIMLAR